MKKIIYIIVVCFFNHLYSQVNLDFEAGNASGWTLTGFSSIQIGAGMDVFTGAFPRVFPGGAVNNTASLMLANGTTPGNTNGSASQTFLVTSANSCFTYNYAAILQAAGHGCACNPVLGVSMTANGVNIPCSAVQVVQGCSNITGWQAGPNHPNGPTIFMPWNASSFDLRPYIGSNVTVTFNAIDCCAGMHFGYAYIDCSAQPMGLYLNGNSIPSNQTNSYLCNGISNVISAPLGFNYLWTGPNATSPANGATTYSINATQAGTYSVSLSVPGLTCANINLWSSFGFIDTPVADFSAAPVCFGSPTSFTNASITPTLNTSLGLLTTYAWDFNDGTPEEASVSPMHLYSGANVNTVYNVSLTATSQSCKHTIVKPVTVGSKPEAAFISNPACYGQATSFLDNSNGNGNVPTNFEWDFSFDGTMDVTGNGMPTYTLPNQGDNLVSYTVSTSPAPGLVCSAYTTGNVWVDPLPEPNFSFVNQCINTPSNTFDASASSIPVGAIDKFNWDFGDGQTALNLLAPTTTNVYANAGVYTVSLTTVSNKGCVKSISHAVEVYQKPIVSIGASALVCLGGSTTFTANSLPTSGNIVLWEWEVNNTVSTVELKGQQTRYAFPTEGLQTINLLATTDYGCQERFSRNVYINYIPKPIFSVDKPIGCHLAHCVSFTDNSTITGPAKIINWNWNYGDGSFLNNTTNINANTCYTNSSTNQIALYTPTLTTKTDSGCVASEIKKDYITVLPKPVANYTVVPEFGTVVVPLVHFVNQSIDYTTLDWQFGDGATDAVTINPDHYYEGDDSKDYYTSLIVTNQHGCSDTAYMLLNIAPGFAFYIPNAFTPNEDNINEGFSGTGIGIANYKMWIYDRWGESVYFTDDIAKKWDGSDKHKDSGNTKQDVYIWKVEIKDVFNKIHNYVGHVTLLK